MARLSRPTNEERSAAAEVYARPFKINVEDQLTEIRDLRRESTTRVRARMAELLASQKVVYENRKLPVLDREPSPPTLRDPSFWWADTRWYSASEIGANFAADGLHFFGTMNRDDQDLIFLNFGAVARFELQHDRLPPSPSGRWTSAPHVELFGSLLAYTDAGNFWTGDCWSKCSMYRRQTILQNVFGGWVVRGEGVQEESLVNEENAHRHYTRPMPGLQWMPPVLFSGVTIDSVWAEIEVRFDVQLEGNSSLWLDPEILLRFFQWPVLAA
jgi:hypothetical protein